MPQGPEQCTEEWYAGERLAFSTMVTRLWNQKETQWHIKVSRVMEKTSAYAVACLQDTYDRVPWEDVDELVQWSDGPRQFKSTTVIGSTANNFMRRYKLKRSTMAYGCPKHFKGAWDRAIGWLTTSFNQAIKNETLNEIADVVRVWRLAAERTMRAHPHGPQYFVEDAFK